MFAGAATMALELDPSSPCTLPIPALQNQVFTTHLHIQARHLPPLWGTPFAHLPPHVRPELISAVAADGICLCNSIIGCNRKPGIQRNTGRQKVRAEQYMDCIAMGATGQLYAVCLSNRQWHCHQQQHASMGGCSATTPYAGGCVCIWWQQDPLRLSPTSSGSSVLGTTLMAGVHAST